MQIVAYYQYLKGKAGGTSPRKEEPCLKATKHKALCTNNYAVLKEVMAAMLGADEFYRQDLHLEGVEVFGLEKHKPNLPLELKYEFY